VPRTRRRHPKNRRPWKGGWQTYVEVHGEPRYKSWPANASTEDMDEWIEDQKKERREHPTRGTFAADVDEFLGRIASARTYRQLSACLTRWLTVLGGDRPRRSIKAKDIDEALQAWERDGMGPTSRQKHRMVMMALWNRLDGKDAKNPVRGVPRPRLPKAEARAVPYPVIRQILQAMPERTDKQRATKRRVAITAYTGIPPGMVGTITPADLDLAAETVRVVPRRKGRGVEARTLPLIPAGVEALRAFDAAGDYGPFRVDMASREFKRAAARAGVRGVRLYDLRHSFATALYREVKDLETVARFLQHSTTALTSRYAKGATADVDRAAAHALGRSLSQKPVRTRKRTMKKRKR
jgi:integrase